MAEVERQERAPLPVEEEIVRGRMARARAALRRHGASLDALFPVVFGALLAAVVQVVFDGFPRWMLTVFGASLVVIGVVGLRRGRQTLRERLATLDRQEAERLATVSEVRFESVGAVTASSPHGDGNAYWLFELPSGAHLVFALEQWAPGEEPPSPWRARASVVLDGWGTVVRTDLEGEPIDVARGDVRPPDFAVTDEHRFWDPPDDLVLPGVVDDVRLQTLDDAGA